MRRPALAGLFCLLLLALAPAVEASEPAYLADWPTTERVLADYQGTDRDDTLARQMAALNQLSLAIDGLAGPRRWREGLTPDEQRLRGQYYDAAGKIRSEVHATLSDELGPGFHGPFAKSPLRRWYSLQWAYERDPDGRRATLSRYLPAGLVAQFDAAAGSPPEKPDEPGDWSWLVWAGVGLAAIALLRWLVRGWRRRQRRRAAIVPAAASTTGESDSDEAAAEEVLDSLEPYMVAAQVDGARIPIGRLLQPYLCGYLIQYCGEALEMLRGKEPSHEEQTRVYEQLLRNPRLGRLVNREGLDAAQRDLESEDGKLAALAGQLMAATVLRVYAGRDDVERELFDRIAQKADRKIGNLRLRGPPRPTRLHPSNPRADDLQRVILLTFTRKLVDPQADGD